MSFTANPNDRVVKPVNGAVASGGWKPNPNDRVVKPAGKQTVMQGITQPWADAVEANKEPARRQAEHRKNGDWLGVAGDFVRGPADGLVAANNYMGAAVKSVGSPIGDAFHALGVDNAKAIVYVPTPRGKPQQFYFRGDDKKTIHSVTPDMVIDKNGDRDFSMERGVHAYYGTSETEQQQINRDVGTNLYATPLSMVVGGGGEKKAGEKVIGEGMSLVEKAANVPVLRPVIRAASKAKQAVTGKPILDPVYQAKQAMKGALKADGATPEQAAGILNRWSETGASDPSLLDMAAKLPSGGESTMSVMREASMKSRPARGVLSTYRKGVEGAVQDNAQDITATLHPDQRTTQKLVSDIEGARQSNAENLYKEPYQTPVDLQKETLSALSDEQGNAALLRSRGAAVANRRWDQVAEIDSLLAAQDKDHNWTFREPGTVPVSDKIRAPAPPSAPPEPITRAIDHVTGEHTVTVPKVKKPVSQYVPSNAYTGPEAPLPAPPQVSAGTLDRARIQMREMAAGAAKDNRNDMARGLRDRVNDIDNSLNKVEAIAPARADYGNLSTNIEAAEHADKNILSDGVEGLPNQFISERAAMRDKLRPVGDAQPTGFDDSSQIAAKNSILENIGKPAEGATGILNKISNKGQNTGKKLANVFGPTRTDRYQEGIGNEVDRVKNARAVDATVGSKTGINTEDAGSGLAAQLVEGMAHVKSGGGTAVYKFIVNALKDGGRLTDEEYKILSELGTGNADLSKLEPVTTKVTTAGKEGAPRGILAGPAAANAASSGPKGILSLPQPASMSAAAQEQEDRRKRSKSGHQ